MATVPSIGRAEPGLRLVRDAGDATRDLYERYGSQIYRFCLRELGNREEAEDAAQTTFLNAFRGLERGVAPEFESAWLYTIAHRVCASRKRSAWRRGRVEAPTDLDAIQELVPSHSPDGGDELFGLRDALEGLPEQQRRALLLREWQGLSCQEIGVELGLSASAVEMLLFRARRGVVRDLTAETPTRRRGLRGRLRTSGDLGSIIAAAKTLFFTGGAKVVVTLATVAASSVVAVTPSTRHEIADLVSPPTAPQAVPTAKPTRAAAVAAAPAHAVVGSPPAKRPVRAETKPPAARAHATVRLHARRVPVRRSGVPAPRVATPQAPTHVAASAATPAPAPTVTPTPAAPDERATPPDASAAPPAAAAPDPAPAATPDPQPVAPAAPVAAVPAPAAAPVLPPAVSVASFSPAGGRAGDTVKIAGAHLSGATSVSFDGVSAQFKVDNDGQLKATVPAGATSGPIAVTGPGGSATSAASFAVTAPPAPPVVTVVHAPVGVVTGRPPVVVLLPPSVGSISPAAAVTGASVAISGSGLAGASSVSFNGVPSSFTVTSDTQISALVPDGATTGRVTVTTPNGTATSSASFTVVAPAPSVSGLAPASAAAGASVTINGSHLSGATAVTFNGVAASFVVVSDAQITAQVPAAATGGPIVVTTPGGTSAAEGFAVLVAPAVTGFTLPPGPPGTVARGKK
jgi:RNA polymerase sigma factor (sigma-70 family)